ncbi:uncharacterized protein [Ambystoma mexicanum]|uniref:uncharacterized protein n=1 Tax=Ambystoma mexicanum TaxID=8296 RepID=UPI0037E76063
MKNPSKMDIETELRAFLRKIRLKDFFSGQSKDLGENMANTPFKPPSRFTPSLNMISKETATFEKVVLRDFSAIYDNIEKKNAGTKCYNFSKEDWAGLKSLRSDRSVVIKKADKGGGVVVWDAIKYDLEVMRQLDNREVYVKLQGDPSLIISREIENLGKDALEREIITQKEFNFLVPKNTRTPLIYMLPKIHKSMSAPPGRPIVSLSGSILEPVGQYLDHFLKPLARNTPTYLSDSCDVIRIVEAFPFNSDHDLLITLDVESLYSNIPQEDSLGIIKRFLQTRTDTISVPSEFLVELLEIALTKNFFRFKNSYYMQIKGTAMGASFAPNYATLYMWDFEETNILTEGNPFRSALKMYKRYIDDIFIIWDSSKGDHKAFFNWINNLNSNLKFTIETSNKEIPFLDLLIKVDKKALVVDLYRKNTDRNTILHHKSFHTQSLKSNIPYGQFLRARRNCTKIEDFLKQSSIIEDRLSERGYPKRLLRQSKKRARYQHRDILLKKDSKERKLNEDQLVCALTFNTQHNKIKKIISSHWHLLQLNMPDLAKPIYAFKKGKNIKNWVSKADRISIQDSQPTITATWGMPPIKGHYPCGNCSNCSSTTATTTVEIHNRNWELRQHSTCLSTNVIYVIICPCKKAYIGKTSRAVKPRIGEHKSKIRTGQRNAPLTCHFLELNHKPEDMRWWVMEKVLGTDAANIAARLAQREQWWIYHTNSLNIGLNQQEEWN